MASLKQFMADTTSNIGDRIINQTLVPTVDLSDVTTLLSNLANRILAITGAANWKDSPAMTIDQISDQTKAITGKTSNIAPPDISLETVSSQIKAITGKAANNTPPDGPLIPSIPDSVTDAHVGDRTVTDTTAPTADNGKLTDLFGWIGNRLKAITGEASWRTNPTTTLQAAATHQADTLNPHSVTAAQAGAIPNGANVVTDAMIGDRTINDLWEPINSTDELTALLSWLANRIKAVTGKPTWFTNPDTTLAVASTHHGNTSNPHGVTAAQTGAIGTSHAAASISGFGASAQALAASQSPGSSTTVSRSDHRHPYPNASEIGAAEQFGDVNNPFNAWKFKVNSADGYQFFGSSGVYYMDSAVGIVKVPVGGRFLVRNTSNQNVECEASQFKASTETGFKFTGSTGSYAMSSTASGVRSPAGGGFHVRDVNLDYQPCYALDYPGPSMRQFKKELGEIVGATNKILSLRAFRYRNVWDDENGKIRAGFSAEDVQKVFPEAVSNINEPIGSVSADKTLGLDYGRLSVLALQAIRELDARITALEAGR
jgi:Chaperone of endosialidase